ncbi:MAG: Holliday junction resolvase RecU [Lachnospiraceae bacterium]
MATWNTRGLRGSVLEEMLNYTIDVYRSKKLALLQKVPTPITPVRIDKDTRQITLAYFDQKSTVDYIGVVQGVPVCFDAKECASLTFALQNVHEHQIAFMEQFEQQQGIAFIILYFSQKDEAYYMPFRDLKQFWERAKEGGRKSFTYEEVDRSFQIKVTGGAYIHFLEQLQLDLISR